jgi:hypothetical protein
MNFRYSQLPIPVRIFAMTLARVVTRRGSSSAHSKPQISRIRLLATAVVGLNSVSGEARMFDASLVASWEK